MGATWTQMRCTGAFCWLGWCLSAERTKRLKKGLFSFALLWVRFVKSVDRLFYISVIWYICDKVNTKYVMIKVIHVHLLYEKKNYYFGSISAIFDVLSEEEVGITKNSLLHAGMSDGSCKITKRAMIIQSHLIRGGK